MKVLFGWELGGGQGHIQRLVALAQMLKSQGVEPVFALKSYKIKGASLPGQIVLAPRLPFSGRLESYQNHIRLQIFLKHLALVILIYCALIYRHGKPL